jgi:2'-5' RNA ligase
MKHTVRTFVAVEIDAATRQRVEQLVEELSALPADVKWVEAHNLHLTLKFLGEVATQEIPQVCEAVRQGAIQVEPFELEVRGAGAFPNTRRPRTLWLGVGTGQQEMVTLLGQIEEPLRKLGFRPEHRRYDPHLTIGRVRRGGPTLAQLGRLIEQHADFDAGRAKVSEVVLFASHLDSTGPTYEALSRAKLGGK